MQLPKDELVRVPILAYPDPEKHFIFDTDVSGFWHRSSVVTDSGWKRRVIAFGSRTMRKEERCFCVMHQELLAVVYFVKHHRHYLY